MTKLNEEIVHRMKMIIEDAQKIIIHLNEGKSLEDQARDADDGYTYFSNILIAADLNDLESLSWGKRNHLNNSLTKPEKPMKELCVSCEIETPYDKTENINNRHNYIRGVGQLCYMCHEYSVHD